MHLWKRQRFKPRIHLLILSCLLLFTLVFYSNRPSEDGILVAASLRNKSSLAPNRENKSTFKYSMINKFDKKGIPVSLPGCSCSRIEKELNDYATFTANLGDSFEESTCSDLATHRGKGQKVIAYSYYNPENNTDAQSEFFKTYLGMMRGRMEYIQKNMPGWVVRIYHNVSSEDSSSLDYMCDLYCSFENLDLCNVTQLPTLGNLYERQPIGRTWRFAVMGDPTVSVFLSRDTDSYILPREVVAIGEWLNSTEEFHLMRDHPNHLALVLAGLWGGRNIRLKKLSELRNTIFSQPADYFKFFDQNLLAKYIFPFIQDSLLQHTSFTCEKFPGSIPFSTKREDGLYTGWGPFKIKPRNFLLKKECPLECRPKEHKDWQYC